MLKHIMVWAGILLLAGCSSISTDYDYNEDINFAELTKWNWLEMTKDTGSHKYHVDGLNDRRIREGLEQQLTAAGLTKVPAAEAQILVNYLTKVENKTDVNTFYTSFGYYPYSVRGFGAGLQADTRVHEYKEGTLIIDIVDAKSKELLWRGAGSDTIKEGRTPAERTEQIQDALKTIFEAYPPGKKK